ncbi:MAG: nucleotidyltransferase domain-containing protein [Nanoarchaeota archaeon]|nr:nucleotidyltransferase domain-containing protein [Nanoarchaeota archaeon]
MSQINYKVRIVESLLKKANHIRGLAKELNTNQTTIARKVKELYRENIVDFKVQGRNKVYFLKRTIEAFQFILIVEHYKLLEILKKYPYLRRVFQEIKQDRRIKLAILFGSHARRTARKESDIDIFIETRDKGIKEKLQKIDSRLSIKIGRFDRKNLLIREIEKNNVIIKGVELYYEKIGFFEKT